MKFLFVLITLLFAGVSAVSAATDPVMCTMEYAPVCGSVQVQCIRAPCYPVRQAFSNACMARVQQATNITQGACDGTVTPPIVGGDSDRHGCKTSAGYRWNSHLQECIQPGVTRTRIMTVLGNTVACVTFGPTQCLQVKQGKRIALIDILNLEFTPVV